MNFGLYVHIPFCARKCAYCDFYSASADDKITARYFAALEREIKLRAQTAQGRLDTVYIGGGTPSLADEKLISRLMKVIAESFDSGISEATIECNPESFSAKKAEAYRAVGLNRISLGVQTLNDKILSYIGRIHNKNTAIKAVELAKMYFDNVSADVMLGLPFQTVGDVKDTLGQLVDLGVKHISAYGLKIEENTPLHALHKNREFEIDDDLAADMYDFSVDFLKSQGYGRYEISNFAREGYTSLHNLAYWQRKPYIGIGAAAHSFDGNTRFNNVRDTAKYISALEKDEIPVENVEILSYDDKKAEAVMLALRTERGLDIKAFNREFDTDFYFEYAEAITNNKDNILIENGYIRIEYNKFYISNGIIADFI